MLFSITKEIDTRGTKWARYRILKKGRIRIFLEKFIHLHGPYLLIDDIPRNWEELETVIAHKEYVGCKCIACGKICLEPTSRIDFIEKSHITRFNIQYGF